MPTIDEMRKSQKAGSVGKGTSPESFADKNACHNQGTGLGEGKDQQFSEAEAGKDADSDDSGY